MRTFIVGRHNENACSIFTDMTIYGDEREKNSTIYRKYVEISKLA